MKHLTFLLLTTLLAGCSDDGLGQSWEPKPGDDDNFGNAFPIQPPATFWYYFTRTYRRTTASDQGGMITGEKQSAGHMCLRVTSVEDTETPAYGSAAETRVKANVKVTGPTGYPDIFIEDMDDASSDASVIDNATSVLWLANMTPPSRGHGLLSPVERTFSTREPPVPGNQELAHTPFFDNRISSNYEWGGWDWRNDDCEAKYDNEADCPEDECAWTVASGCQNKAENFLNRVLIYFITELGSGPYQDSALFSEYHPVASACDNNDNPTACGMAQCYWDWNTSECVVDYTIDMRWRHTITTGEAELQGPVLHSVELRYNENGSLRSARELIAPDANSASPSSSDLDSFSNCFANEPCATATIELYADPWADAICTF